MDKVQPTRRAVLGVAAVLPAAALLGGAARAAASASPSDWETALGKFRQADAAMNAYDRDHLTPVSRAYQAVRDKLPTLEDFAKDPEALAELERASAVYDPAQKRFDELVDEQFNACKDLLETPAPDARALVVKLDILIEHEVYDWSVGDDVLAAIQRDARHLLAGGRA